MPTAPASRFQQDIYLAAAGEGRFHGELSSAWSIGPIPNGGYVMAVACNALAMALDCPHQASITGHYVQPTEAGPVQIETEVIRRGRRLSTGVAKLIQGGVERARFVGTFTDLALSSGVDLHTVSPPEISDISQCVPMAELSPRPTAIHEHLLARLDPASATHWQRGHPDAPTELCAWLGFADGGQIDVFSLPLFADAQPPPLFRRIGFGGWVPTVELTVHVHRKPAPGLLRARFVTHHVTAGLLHEDGELWDSAGHLVALSRQLAMVVSPPTRRNNGAPAD
ncbi:thioesterase family protein [Immundisolibacter sp.]|uniref:thioesterase family protein n=1 Tax=Immundisolibacter sp. TaxID=1934948 RepID=UPI00356ACCEF